MGEISSVKSTYYILYMSYIYQMCGQELDQEPERGERAHVAQRSRAVPRTASGQATSLQQRACSLSIEDSAEVTISHFISGFE